MDRSRLQTIENIRANVAAGEFNRKAEPGDPQLDTEQIHELLRRTVYQRGSLPYRIKNGCAHVIADVACHLLNRSTVFEGLDKVRDLRGPAIITTNHFDFLDCTIMHELGRRLGKGHIFGVSQATNFAMPGFFGFILKYYDMIPVSDDKAYMKDCFEPLLRKVFDSGKYLLIYPEQEMWWHYRKPRPVKRGAYFYAAKFGVPVIPCFTEMREYGEKGGDGLRRLRYTVHVMDPIHPDPEMSPRDVSLVMMEKDYALKKAAYEAAYGKHLDYGFEPWDIAGTQ